MNAGCEDLDHNKLMQWSDTQVKCLLCGVLFPKVARSVEEHVNGAKHRESLTYMSKNGISVVNDKIFCKPCNLILPKNDYVMNHINGVGHCTWMALMSPVLKLGEIENFHRHLAQDAGNIFCTLCKASIPCDRDLINDHLASLQHKMRRCEYLSKSNAMFNMPDDKVWCKLCNLLLDNDAHKLLRHIKKDRTHTTRLVELEDRVQFEGVNIEKYFSILEETKVLCERCDIEIACNSKAMEAHIHTQNHLHRVVKPENYD